MQWEAFSYHSVGRDFVYYTATIVNLAPLLVIFNYAK